MQRAYTIMEHIKNKLRAFVIRYHTNEMIRGGIFTLAGLITAFLILVTAEYFGYFPSLIRLILGFAYMLFALIILYKNVFLALFKIYGISRPMSHDRAARYIGAYLPEVSDKLTNLLELSGQDKRTGRYAAFLEKAIDQKANELKPFDFPKVIDFSVNRRHLRYLLPPALVFLALIFAAPDIITDPATRIVHYNTAYERPQPFYIELENKSLEAIQGDNITLKAVTKGESTPNTLYLRSQTQQYRFLNSGTNTFELTLTNVRDNLRFIITDGVVKSREYQLVVRSKPEITGYTIRMDFPEYMNRETEYAENTGDLDVPRGTAVTWDLTPLNTTEIQMFLREGEEQKVHKMKDTFRVQKRAMNDFSYTLVSRNEYVTSSDSLTFSVSVVPDMYPEIELTLADDSSDVTRAFFSGIINDDYGFTSLNFAWKKPEDQEFKTIPLSLDKGLKRQMFHFSLRTDTLLSAGEKIDIFFEVSDNDMILGPKTSTTPVITLEEPSRDEVEEKIRQQRESLQETATQATSQAQEVNQEFEELRKRLLEKRRLDWQDREAIRQTLEKAQELQSRIQEMKEAMEEMAKEEERIREKHEGILEKEEKLKKLMEELLDEELLRKIEELKKMMEESQDPDKIRQSLEEMSQDNLDMEKELERSLELFKRLQVEKELRDAIDMLDELQEKQEEAREAGEEEKVQEQEGVNEDFEKIREKLENARQKDQELQKPMGVEDTGDEEQELEDKLQEALDQLNQGNNQEGSESQQDAQSKMEDLSNSLQQMMQQMKQDNTGEDMRLIRQLLDNTLKLSLEQEALMESFSNTSHDDPRFVELIQQQRDLNQGLEKVKDSLFALSKRQFMVESFINREVGDIDRNMKKAMDAMLAMNTIMQTQRRDRSETASRQQYVMTGLNNIALMLAESLEQMKEQMQNQGNMESDQMCDDAKPGQSGSPGLQQMQQQLNDMLDQMMEDMQNDQSEQDGGDDQDGDSEQNGDSGQDGDSEQKGQSMSERFARSAAQQRQIRRELEELRRELQKQGDPAGKTIGETLNEMEKTEKDLVNKILNAETLKRQEEILTRLLEHDEAKRKQEMEEEREAEHVKSQEKRNPGEFLEYKRIIEQETELLRMAPPELTPFFRNKLNDYYINLNQ